MKSIKAALLRISKVTLMSIVAGCFAFTVSAVAATERVDKETSTTSSTTQIDSSDEQSIRKGADAFVKSMTAGDAKGIADLCAEDCCFTDIDGATFNGRAEIKQMYEKNFATFGIQPITLRISKINFPTSDVAVEDGQISGANTYSTSTYSIVHVKKDGSWKMLRINEHANNITPSEALKSLDWMIGDWTLHGSNRNVSLKVTTINHGNYLALRFSDGVDNEISPAQMQIIGWNARTRDIVSWNFGHDGGFGYGHWRKDGDNWFISTRGTTHEGEESTANYIIKHPDAQHFSWESIERSINGMKLPNTGVVEATRSNANGK